jgi:hypothetical protein
MTPEEIKQRESRHFRGQLLTVALIAGIVVCFVLFIALGDLSNRVDPARGRVIPFPGRSQMSYVNGWGVVFWAVGSACAYRVVATYAKYFPLMPPRTPPLDFGRNAAPAAQPPDPVALNGENPVLERLTRPPARPPRWP